MLYWIVDRALLFGALLGLAAVGFGILYWNNRDRKSLRAFGVTTGLGLLLWLLTLFIVTDRQQLTRNLRAMADAVVAKKPEDMKKYLAAELYFNAEKTRVDRDTVLTLAKQQAVGLHIEGIRLTQFHFENVSRTDAKAEVFFSAVIDMQGMTHPCQCKAGFLRRDDAWLLQSLEVFTPVGNQPIPIPVR